MYPEVFYDSNTKEVLDENNGVEEKFNIKRVFFGPLATS